MTRSQRSRAASIAANTRWSREDPAEQGRKMRAGLDRRFLDEVDPDRTLPEAERTRRAEAARKAFYTRLAAASVAARANRRRADPDPESRIVQTIADAILAELGDEITPVNARRAAVAARKRQR